MSVSTLGSVSECTGLGHTSALFAQISIGQGGSHAQAVSALEKPHGSKCPPCTASHKLREVIHRGDKALPLARLVGGRGLSRGLCRSLGMTRRVRLHQGQAGA